MAEYCMNEREFRDLLIRIATKLNTRYINQFPYNCGYYADNGKFSWDCWNLPKSIVWGWRENETVGYYCYQPGKYGLGDWDGAGVLYHCSDVSSDFSDLNSLEFLLTPDKRHAGCYVGEFTDRMGQLCNVVECTTSWNSGRVIGSWVDADGTRRNCKGGSANYRWGQHGKMTDWVDYNEQPKPVPEDRVTVKDYWDREYTIALQVMWDCKIVDGEVSRQAKSDRSAVPNLLPVGESGGTAVFKGWPGYIGGSALIKEIQKWVGVRADGNFGANSVRAWQKAMNDNGYGPIGQDGVFGPHSARVMGEWINDWYKRHPNA